MDQATILKTEEGSISLRLIVKWLPLSKDLNWLGYLWSTTISRYSQMNSSCHLGWCWIITRNTVESLQSCQLVSQLLQRIFRRSSNKSSIRRPSQLAIVQKMIYMHYRFLCRSIPQLYHNRVIDTSVLYMTQTNRKLSLKSLALKFLNLSIQKDTHDSVEDAKIALALARLRIELLENFTANSFHSN